MWGATLLCLWLAALHSGAAVWAAPLAPPDAAACTRDTMYEATSKEHSCSETLYHRKDAVEPCCRVLSEYYGPNSTRPSRNCFCLESYWTPFIVLSDKHYIQWAKYFTQCSGMGHPVYYYQDGEGECAGPPEAPAPDTTEPPAAEPAEPAGEEEVAPVLLPMRSFSGWVAGLGDDGWGAASFAAAILSVLGCGMMAWSFVFDAWADIIGLWTSRRTLK